MSANNSLLVKELEKQFKIIMKDADTGVQLGRAKYAKTLREACKIAQAWQDWEGVEYGIHFELN